VLRIAGFARYGLKRSLGYATANPYWRDCHGFSDEAVAKSLREILDRLPARQLNTVIDHGCGDGLMVPALRKIASTVVGIDVLPEARAVDRYIRVDTSSPDLSGILDCAVDAIFVLHYVGFSPGATWRAYLSPHNERLATYLEPHNFARIVAPGGFLILSEWEAEPEVRWSKVSIDEANERAAEVYDPLPVLPGFRLAACGFTRAIRSPFVAYLKV
jgi:SAM-dependent methyltransferase